MNRLIYVIMISSALLSGCDDSLRKRELNAIANKIQAEREEESKEKRLTSAEKEKHTLDERLYTIIQKIDEREIINVPRKTLVNGYLLQESHETRTIGKTYIIARDYYGKERKFEVDADVLKRLELNETVEFNERMLSYEIKPERGGRPR